LDRELPMSIPIMDGLTAAAASGMRARMESLDMLANNLANASAPGFKTDREHYSTYLAAEAAASPAGDVGSVMPVIERQWTDFSQGTLLPTGNPLDLALRGKGFFVATSSGGPLLTRDGSFRLSPQGELETQEGFKVRGQDGNPIQVDPSKRIEITPAGEVRQNGQVVAQIDVVEIKDPSALSKHGMNYFQCSATQMTPLSDAQMQQGSREAATLQPAESAVRLIAVMRQFEMLQRAAAVGSDMSRRALDEVAKATG
jgi:flagellar basal-body rod protein FlgF